MASCLLGQRVTGQAIEGAISIRMAVLQSREDRQGLLPSNEPDRPYTLETASAFERRSKRSGIPWGRSTTKCSLSTTVQPRTNQAEVRCRNRHGSALAAEGSPKDLRDILRRAHAGVVDRNPWPRSVASRIATMRIVIHLRSRRS